MNQPQNADCPDPLDIILKEHDAHQVLCNLLEEIADSLPDDVDLTKARCAVDVLKNELPQHHRIEEEALFPTLMKYAVEEDNVGEIVARLNEEHIVDEGFAEELIEILEDLAQGQKIEDANMFGYMLRGFFENYRRHIMWENNVVLPLARRRLPAEGLRELASLIVGLRARFADESGGVSGTIIIDTQASLCNGECEDCKRSSD